MALHKDLTGADLHEPKGVETAAVGRVYVSNGAGSGSWKKPGLNEIDPTGIPGLTTFSVSARHDNINTTKTAYAIMGRTGNVTTIFGVIDATVTTDVVLNVQKNGSTPIATATVAAASTAGQSFAITFTTPVSVVPGDVLAFSANGTGATPCVLTLEIVLAY